MIFRAVAGFTGQATRSLPQSFSAEATHREIDVGAVGRIGRI